MEKGVFQKFFLMTYAAVMAVYFLIGFLPAANAEDYQIGGSLNIPSINLSTDVAELELSGNTLVSPGEIAGEFTNAKNKLLIIGHAKTVFHNLIGVQTGDEFDYTGENEEFSGKFKVSEVKILEKSKIDMSEILAAEEEPTIVIMTCAGEMLSNTDATERLIITAKRIK